ncbi:MAG: hypothetical protein SVT52_07880 [Planctomycetota bacterium]|nr:hypothetical protein [Planctomycetota bacterium]
MNLKTPWDQYDVCRPDTGEYLSGDHYPRCLSIWTILLSLGRSDPRTKTVPDINEFLEPVDKKRR